MTFNRVGEFTRLLLWSGQICALLLVAVMADFDVIKTLFLIKYYS